MKLRDRFRTRPEGPTTLADASPDLKERLARVLARMLHDRERDRDLLRDGEEAE